jgi:DNA repair exonuclease SbcCD ATPase subunit
MKIKKIIIKEYKLFRDAELTFKDGLNLITGPGGSGKTILFDMLKEGIFSKNENYKVEIDGRIDKKQMDYIFIDWDKFSEKISNAIPSLPCGEKILLTLGMIIGYRSSNNIQAPLVLDSPCGKLDEDKRGIFLKIINELSFSQQVILFEHESVLKSFGMFTNFNLVIDKNNKGMTKIFRYKKCPCNLIRELEN